LAGRALTGTSKKGLFKKGAFNVQYGICKNDL
jgi:hypothetical protein